MNSIINILEFNNIVAGVKAMKADLVYVKGNMLYGTDNNCMTLKTHVMDVPVTAQPFTIVTKSLSSEFFNSIIDTSITIDLDENTMYCSSNRYLGEKQPVIDNSMNNRIECIISNLNYDIYKPFVNKIEFGDVTDDTFFQRFKEIKSGEGADLYTPKGNQLYGMFLYSGAIPMVKADKLGLIIYDLGNTFIANYIISKKKLNPINVYFRFVKLQKGV